MSTGQPTVIAPSPIEEITPQVSSYSQLPDPTSNSGKLYYVLTSTGLWPFNRKSRGFYRSNGVVWEYGGELTDALSTDNFAIYDSSDPSKQLKFSLDSLSTGTTAYISVPSNTDLGQIRNPNLITNVNMNGNVQVGDFVYISTFGVYERAKADSIDTANIIGVITEKTSITTGHVLVNGLTPELFSGLSIGSRYFLSSENPGQITTAVPATPAGCIVAVGIAVSETQILINKQKITILSL